MFCTERKHLSGSQHFNKTKFPDFSLTNVQNYRIIILTYFQFETIFDAIAEKSSCNEQGVKLNILVCIVRTLDTDDVIVICIDANVSLCLNLLIIIPITKSHLNCIQL